MNILYIDDEENNLRTFKANFREHYRIFTAISANEGKKILKNENVQVIVADQRMPDITGVQFLQSIVNEYPDTVRFILTGYSDMEVLLDAIHKKHIHRYLMKPFDENEMKIALDNAFELYFLRKERKELLEKLSKYESS